MSGRTWAAVVVVVVMVVAEAGYGGYQLGLRSGRPGAPKSSGSHLPSPSPVSTGPSPVSTASPQTGPFPPAYPVHNTVVDTLRCRLPVYLPGKPGSGGFVSFPDGTVTPDSSSSVYAPGTGDWFGLTYDSAINRWLPVPRAWVTPDGLVYVFGMDFDRHAGSIGLFEVNAQNDSSATIYPTGGEGWQVIDVEAAYIYAILQRGQQGLYVLTLSGPPQRTDVSDGYWRAGSGFYAYGSTFPGGGAIVRMDSRNPTQRVPWFNKSGSAEITGFDGSGNPIIWTGTDLWIASAPDQATRISSKAPLPLPTPASGFLPIYGALAPVPDSHGLWFSTTDGIYLYAAGQTTKVSDLVAQVAGDC